MSKRFTVMVIPEAGEKVRRLQIHSRASAFAVACCLLFVGLFAFLLYSRLNLEFDQAELERLRVENSQQRLVLQRLAVDFDSLHEQMIMLADNEARVRQLASFEDSSQTVPVAIGGIPAVDRVSAVDEIQQRISQLQLAIDMRRQSQEDVRNLLNDQVSLSRATPKGWPTKGWITSYFGMRQIPQGTGKRMHKGIDIAANTGTPIFATADGIVARVEYSAGYGKTVILDHGYGYRTLFGHNSKNLVKSGQRIRRGDKIAEVGNTGRSTGPHVHYEVQLNSIPIDPRHTL
ncbi:MAG: M23 family metallopeptidase [Chloroflexi bacterium]|nr:M23 family metallopeptidase [Chloroflexota bacterium]